MALLDVEAYLGQNNYTVSITGGRNVDIQAFITESISLSATGEVGNQASGVGGGGITSTVAEASSAIIGTVIKTRYQSQVKWTGSGTPQLSLALLFLNTGEYDRQIKKKLQSLNSLVYSPSDKPEGYLDFTYKAPYLWEDNKLKYGLVVRVGEYLLIKDMVATSCDFTMSKELTPQGKPLYATASLSLQYSEMPVAEVVNSWLV